MHGRATSVHLSDADNQDKIDQKIVNMRKKYLMGPELSHNSTVTNAVKRQRQVQDRESVLGGVATADQALRVNVRRKKHLVRRDCVDLVDALQLHGDGEVVDASWAADFQALVQFQRSVALDNFVHNEHLRELGREKQRLRAEAINHSNLGVRVMLWDEAEILAQPIVETICSVVGSDHVFYVGATVFKEGSTGYCTEALACMLDKDRRPVVFPKDADRCSVDQVLCDYGFQVMHLTHRVQYMEVRMLETCIHVAMHHLPGRLWLYRGAGPYLSKLQDVQRQLHRGTISSLFLAFAPKARLSGHAVRVRDNMPALQAFLNC